MFQSYKRRNEGGFSLIESVIGMLVVGILITGLYGVITSGFRTEQWNREDLRATQILIEKMDQLRVISWEDLNDASVVPRTFQAALNPEETASLRTRVISIGGVLTNTIVVGPRSDRALLFTGTVEVLDAPNDTAYSSEMKQVRVTVNWTSAAGMPRSRSFTTFVARYGMQNYQY
jgi:prepilin-type N-terminal cleavage/methylation domain-containing protein